MAVRTLTPDDIRGVVGILPTPATPDADQWACTASVDLDETARMTRRIVEGGVSILMTCGSFGEGPTLLADECEDFTKAIRDAMAGRGVLFAGVTTLNTRETIARARRLVALGAHGLFVGRPMWMALDSAPVRQGHPTPKRRRPTWRAGERPAGAGRACATKSEPTVRREPFEPLEA